MTEKLIIEKHFSNTATVWRDRIYKSKKTQRAWEYFDKQYRFDYVIEMISSLPGGQGRRVLDIGCGAGQLIPTLTSMGYDVEANDISPNMVKIAQDLCARDGLKAVVTVGDCEALTNANKSLDLIVAMGVIEYMDEDGPMLREVNRVLKVGGTAIITFRNVRCWNIRWRGLYMPFERFLRNVVRRMQGRPANVYKAISREHDPRDVQKTVQKFGFVPRREQYSHYHTLPSPLDRILSPISAVLGKTCERIFKRNPLPRLASTYILKFEKIADAPSGHTAKN